MEKNTIFEIKFFGEEIPLIFRAADILLLPYVVPYGASGVIKLAATYKIPVITPYSISREGEIIDGISGVLISSFDEKNLAQKINQLLDNKSSLVKMGERFYKENFNKILGKKSYRTYANGYIKFMKQHQPPMIEGDHEFNYKKIIKDDEDKKLEYWGDWEIKILEKQYPKHTAEYIQITVCHIEQKKQSSGKQKT